MENKIFCLRVSDKIKMYNFVFTFVGFIISNHILYFNFYWFST